MADRHELPHRNIVAHFIGWRLAIAKQIGPVGEYHIVYDAEWVTDAENREGHGSPSVMVGSWDECVEFCRKVERGEIQTEPHESNFEGWPALRRRVQFWHAEGKPPVPVPAD